MPARAPQRAGAARRDVLAPGTGGRGGAPSAAARGRRLPGGAGRPVLRLAGGLPGDGARLGPAAAGPAAGGGRPRAGSSSRPGCSWPAPRGRPSGPACGCWASPPPAGCSRSPVLRTPSAAAAWPGRWPADEASVAAQETRPTSEDRAMSRVAHPAGPRHADVLPAEHPPTPPQDLNALHPAIWPQLGPPGGRRAHGRRAGRARPGRRVRHPAVRLRRGRLPAALPQLPRGVRGAGRGVLRGQGVLLPRRAALGHRGRPRRGRVHRRRAGGGPAGGRPARDDHIARQQQAGERAGPRAGRGGGPHRGRLVRGDRPPGLPDRSAGARPRRLRGARGNGTGGTGPAGTGRRNAPRPAPGCSSGSPPE